MNQGEARYCKRCGLPSTVPSARLDDSGICSYCLEFDRKGDLDIKRKRLREEFESLVASCLNRRRGQYDVVAAYSGGKDSTFILDLLKNVYGLRVLALTFDHGFVSPYAVDNMRKITESLDIDHVTFKPRPKLVARIFRFSIDNEFHPPRALERASSICNTCMGLVKPITLRTAVEKDIPLVAYGWSPGQISIQSAIFKNQPVFVRKAQGFLLKQLMAAAGPEVKSYFLDEVHFSEKEFPWNINPFVFLKYDEAAIYRRIAELGWSRPKDTDANSTNCLLNSFANQVHYRKHGYHPYALEMAWLVREGILPRDEALCRLDLEADFDVLQSVKRGLGIA